MNTAGYERDIFISYRHECPTTQWLRQVFLIELEKVLKPLRPNGIIGGVEKPTDEHMTPGSNWPEWLHGRVARSRILLPALTPYYFGSSWCRRELALMLERQRIMGLCSAENTQGLVIPIQLADGDTYPSELRAQVQFQDFRDYTRVKKGTKKWNQFLDEVEKLAHTISAVLDSAPCHELSWKELTGKDIEPKLIIPDPPSYRMPRLSDGFSTASEGGAP